MSGETIIRVSSLPNYADCQRRAAAGMFRAEIQAMGYTLNDRRPSIGAAIGTAVHAGAAMMLKVKATTGGIPPESVTADCAVETVRAEVTQGDMIYDPETPELNTAEQQALRMTRSYRKDIQPDIQPMIVEERMEAVIPWSRSGLVLSGQSDVLAREPGRLRDLKTGKRLSNYNAQLGGYSLLARTNGLDVSEAGIDYVQRVAMKKPQPMAATFRHQLYSVESAAIATLKHIDIDLTTFRIGDPERGIMPGDPQAFLANPASMLCSAKWCIAHGTDFCHEWIKGEEE